MKKIIRPEFKKALLLYKNCNLNKKDKIRNINNNELTNTFSINQTLLATSKNLNYHSRGKSELTKAQDNLSAVLHGVNDLRLVRSEKTTNFFRHEYLENGAFFRSVQPVVIMNPRIRDILEQRPIPEILDHEVLLEMDCVGICGTDIHFLVNGRVGDFILTEPIVIGHEGSGIVCKIGKSVKNLKAGDRVGIEPGAPCRMCELCKTGRYNLCPNYALHGLPPNNGSLTRFYKHRADLCYKLPDHVTMEEGALLEPLSVAVHGCRRGGVELGSEVLILGAGPIGLVTLLTAQAMGASNILITDINQHKLDIAECLGATSTLLTKNLSEEESLEKVHECMGTKPTISIDCCGAESTARLAILATRSGGCAVIVGMGPSESKIPLISALISEVDIRGSFTYNNDFHAALALIASGKMDFTSLITHHYDIEDSKAAFETVRTGCGKPIKVMIHCQPCNKNNPKE